MKVPNNNPVPPVQESGLLSNMSKSFALIITTNLLYCSLVPILGTCVIIPILYVVIPLLISSPHNIPWFSTVSSAVMHASLFLMAIFSIAIARLYYIKSPPFPPPRLSWRSLAAVEPAPLALVLAFVFCTVAIPVSLHYYSIISSPQLPLLIVSATFLRIFLNMVAIPTDIPVFSITANWQSTFVSCDSYFKSVVLPNISFSVGIAIMATLVPLLTVNLSFLASGLSFYFPPLSSIFMTVTVLSITSLVTDFVQKVSLNLLTQTHRMAGSNCDIINAIDAPTSTLALHHALWSLMHLIAQNPSRREQIYKDQPTLNTWTRIQTALLNQLNTFATNVTMFDLPLRPNTDKAATISPCLRATPSTASTLMKSSSKPSMASSSKLNLESVDEPPIFNGQSGSVSQLWYRSNKNNTNTTSFSPLSMIHGSSSMSIPNVSSSGINQPTYAPITSSGLPSVPFVYHVEQWLVIFIKWIWSWLAPYIPIHEVFSVIQAITWDTLMLLRLGALSVQYQIAAWSAISLTQFIIYAYRGDPYGLLYPELNKIIPTLLNVMESIEKVQEKTKTWRWEWFEMEVTKRKRMKQWVQVGKYYPHHYPKADEWDWELASQTYPLQVNNDSIRKGRTSITTRITWIDPHGMIMFRLAYVYDACTSSLIVMYVRYPQFINEQVMSHLSESHQRLFQRLVTPMSVSIHAPNYG